MKKTILLLSVILLFGCKKKAAPATKTAATTSNTNWNGMFVVAKGAHFSSGGIQSTDYAGHAAFGFGTGSTWLGDPSQEVQVDTVKLNGVTMEYSSSEYYDTLGLSAGAFSPITYPYTFKVAGKNGIPSFTYTENGPYPDYTGYTNLPDTFYKNNNLVIPISGIANADFLTVTVINDNGGAGKEISQQFSNTFPASVTFSAASMSQFNISNNSTIVVELQKWDTQTFGGKAMLFATLFSFSKTCSVK